LKIAKLSRRVSVGYDFREIDQVGLQQLLYDLEAGMPFSAGS
jgi:hypothetical protein